MKGVERNQTTYNYGIRREDLFTLLIVHQQVLADELRRQKANGEFRYLAEYNNEKADYLSKNTFGLYQFSNYLGTVNYALSHANKNLI